MFAKYIAGRFSQRRRCQIFMERNGGTPLISMRILEEKLGQTEIMGFPQNSVDLLDGVRAGADFRKKCEIGLTHRRIPLCSVSRCNADSGGFPECSSLRAHDRAGFVSLLIGSEFGVYRNGRTLIFDSLVSDFEHDIGVSIRLRPAAAGLRRDEFRGRNSE